MYTRVRRANIGVACRILDAGYAHTVSDEKIEFIYMIITYMIWYDDKKY